LVLLIEGSTWAGKKHSRAGEGGRCKDPCGRTVGSRMFGVLFDKDLEKTRVRKGKKVENVRRNVKSRW